ncbi:hypothetical protein [Halopelagius fulvigenes]|uniref:Uncharacterized protein n=1 Tax=Halopelagius fulvigenes TaxID=1198324 RepID=A0ABD5TUU8_9EURY
MSERTSAPAAVTDAAGSDSPPDADDADESGIRTATRLLRLLKVALGAVVSFLTALKLLGLL